MFGVDEETVMMGHLLLCRLPAGESSVCTAELIRCHCFVLRFSSPSLPLLLFLLFSLSCRSTSYMPDLNRNYTLRAPSWMISHLCFLCVCFVIMYIHSDSCFADYLVWHVLFQVTMVERRSAMRRPARSSSWMHIPSHILYDLHARADMNMIKYHNIFPHIYNILHNIKYSTTITSFSGFYFEKKMHSEQSHCSAGNACWSFGGTTG